DGLNGLDAGGAGADHGDALAGEIDLLLRPARGVEGLSLEGVAAFDHRQRWRRERTNRRDEEAARMCVAVLQRDAPASRVLLIVRRSHPAPELDIPPQVELVGNKVAIA